MSTTALITGASSGLGAVYANRFAARGHSLILVARRGERLETLAAELRESFNIEVGNIVADLTSEAGIASVEAVLRNETVDILVNNAGMGPIGKTANLSDADAAATLTLNVTALMRLTRAALPAMRARKAGTIINVSSVLAFHALPVTTLYSATKAFVLTYSQGLAHELAEDGILIQAVLPAGTVTEFYEAAGVSISDFDPKVFMTAE